MVITLHIYNSRTKTMIGIRSTHGRIRKPLYPKSVVTLAGSARIPAVRHLTEQDLPAMQDHLLSLTDGDRDRRFNNCMSDGAIIRYVRSLDFNRMIFTGAFDMESGRLIGMAEAHMDNANTPVTSEMSICVLPEYRGRKMGADLLSLLFATVSERGARKAVFFFQPNNRAIARLLKLFANTDMLNMGFATVTLAHVADAAPQQLAA
jgi:ribosomal protein S18 acetylase RimI-like enzyme